MSTFIFNLVGVAALIVVALNYGIWTAIGVYLFYLIVSLSIALALFALASWIDARRGYLVPKPALRKYHAPLPEQITYEKLTAEFNSATLISKVFTVVYYAVVSLVFLLIAVVMLV